MKLFNKHNGKVLSFKKLLLFCNTAILISGAAPEAHSALIHPLDERHVLEVPISQEGLTH